MPQDPDLLFRRLQTEVGLRPEQAYQEVTSAQENGTRIVIYDQGASIGASAGDPPTRFFRAKAGLRVSSPQGNYFVGEGEIKEFAKNQARQEGLSKEMAQARAIESASFLKEKQAFSPPEKKPSQQTQGNFFQRLDAESYKANDSSRAFFEKGYFPKTKTIKNIQPQNQKTLFTPRTPSTGEPLSITELTAIQTKRDLKRLSYAQKMQFDKLDLSPTEAGFETGITTTGKKVSFEVLKTPSEKSRDFFKQQDDFIRLADERVLNFQKVMDREAKLTVTNPNRFVEDVGFLNAKKDVKVKEAKLFPKTASFDQGLLDVKDPRLIKDPVGFVTGETLVSAGVGGAFGAVAAPFTGGLSIGAGVIGGTAFGLASSVSVVAADTVIPKQGVFGLPKEAALTGVGLAVGFGGSGKLTKLLYSPAKIPKTNILKNPKLEAKIGLIDDVKFKGIGEFTQFLKKGDVKTRFSLSGRINEDIARFDYEKEFLGKFAKKYEPTTTITTTKTLKKINEPQLYQNVKKLDDIQLDLLKAPLNPTERNILTGLVKKESKKNYLFTVHPVGKNGFKDIELIKVPKNTLNQKLITLEDVAKFKNKNLLTDQHISVISSEAKQLKKLLNEEIYKTNPELKPSEKLFKVLNKKTKTTTTPPFLGDTKTLRSSVLLKIEKNPAKILEGFTAQKEVFKESKGVLKGQKLFAGGVFNESIVTDAKISNSLVDRSIIESVERQANKNFKPVSSQFEVIGQSKTLQGQPIRTVVDKTRVGVFKEFDVTRPNESVRMVGEKINTNGFSFPKKFKDTFAVSKKQLDSFTGGINRTKLGFIQRGTIQSDKKLIDFSLSGRGTIFGKPLGKNEEILFDRTVKTKNYVNKLYGTEETALKRLGKPQNLLTGRKGVSENQAFSFKNLKNFFDVQKHSFRPAKIKQPKFKPFSDNGSFKEVDLGGGLKGLQKVKPKSKGNFLTGVQKTKTLTKAEKKAISGTIAKEIIKTSDKLIGKQKIVSRGIPKFSVFTGQKLAAQQKQKQAVKMRSLSVFGKFENLQPKTIIRAKLTQFPKLQTSPLVVNKAVNIPRSFAVPKLKTFDNIITRQKIVPVQKEITRQNTGSVYRPFPTFTPPKTPSLLPFLPSKPFGGLSFLPPSKRQKGNKKRREGGVIIESSFFLKGLGLGKSIRVTRKRANIILSERALGIGVTPTEEIARGKKFIGI